MFYEPYQTGPRLEFHLPQTFAGIIWKRHLDIIFASQAHILAEGFTAKGTIAIACCPKRRTGIQFPSNFFSSNPFFLFFFAPLLCVLLSKGCRRHWEFCFLSKIMHDTYFTLCGIILIVLSEFAELKPLYCWSSKSRRPSVDGYKDGLEYDHLTHPQRRCIIYDDIEISNFAQTFPRPKKIIWFDLTK